MIVEPSREVGLMPFKLGLTLALVLVCSPFSRAQLPTATGRTITLSTSPNHKLFIPDGYVHTGQAVDVLVHFHGDPATVNNNAKYANLNAVIVNVTYSGLSSAYATPFSDPALFANVMNDALAKLRAQGDFPDNTTWGNQCISSFSAGYGAVREILKQQTSYDQIDGLLLADSLYATFTAGSDHSPQDLQMVDFRRFAQAAKQGGKTLIFSHSQVPTYTYCTTEECANDLIAYVGATSQSYNGVGLGPTQFFRRSDLGNFHVLGATGTDGDAHLLHLQYMGQHLGGLPLAHVPEPSVVLLGVTLFISNPRRARR